MSICLEIVWILVKLLISDDNCNVIDSFKPFINLTEDTAEGNHNSVIIDDEKETAHRVGESLEIAEDTTVSVSKKATTTIIKEKSSNFLFMGF